MSQRAYTPVHFLSPQHGCEIGGHSFQGGFAKLSFPGLSSAWSIPAFDPRSTCPVQSRACWMITDVRGWNLKGASRVTPLLDFSAALGIDLPSSDFCFSVLSELCQSLPAAAQLEASCLQLSCFAYSCFVECCSTIGSFLLTVELLCLQLFCGVICLQLELFYLQFEFLLTMEACLLAVEIWAEMPDLEH